MFKSLRRITYKVDDLAKAKQWYGAILDAKPAFDSPFAVIFRVGDCSLSLAKGAAPHAEFDERYETFWEVDDIEAAYKRLIEAGAQPHTPVRSILNIRIAKVFDPFGNTLGLTGMDTNAKSRTVENHPSESAMTVAFCRALAAIDEREEIKGPDYLAKLFLTEELKKPLGDQAAKDMMLRHLSSLYAGIICRTSYIDRHFTAALAHNIPQVVFLGAGYDTRSYRFRELLKNTRIFEVDAQSTQKRKLDILKTAGIEIPKAVNYVNANFKTDALHEILNKAGYKETEKTLFIWEGVSYYLTKDAVDGTLLFIKSHSARGSALCFDYLTQKQESVYAAEPFLFWMSPTEIKSYMNSNGITITENLMSDDLEQRYLKLKDGTLAEKALPHFAFGYGVKS